MMLFICIWLVVLTAIILLFWRDMTIDLKTIKEYAHDIWDDLETLETHLTTEIACLAIKNNEDIKRMKGDYAVGDILRFDGIRWRVFGKDTLDDGRTCWRLFNENGQGYSIFSDHMPADIEFLGHRDLSFE